MKMKLKIEYVSNVLLKTLARLLLEKELNKIIKKTPPHLSILDIGSSNAPYKKLLKSKKYTTLDINKRSNPDICCDAHEIPCKKESFDLILSTEFLEHSYDPKKAISELARVLKKGGSCVLSTRLIKEVHGEPFDYFRFTKYGLIKLFSGFEKVEIIPLGNGFSSIWDLISFFLPPIRIINCLFLPFINSKRTEMPGGYFVFAKK